MKLGKRSEANLAGVHPDLVRVVRRAIHITATDFTVIEGLRTLERQKELFAMGASKTMNSRHLTGHAVDLVNIEDGVANWGKAAQIAAAMKEAARLEGVNIVWGGDWKTFKDGPHFELAR